VIPLSAINGYDLTLESLSTAALADLRSLLSSLEGISPDRTRAVLFEAFPEVFNPYAAASSDVSASFYEEVRDLAGVKGSFSAETLDTVEADRWGALVGAGTQPRMLEQGASNLMFTFLSGGLTSILSTMAADTIYGNAQKDPVTARFQRVPKAGCCGFCGMLASRGADYDSEESALRVVGRGVPVHRTQGKRGGQGKGIKARGSQAVGEKFHDHCKCRTVQVYEGNAVEMQNDASTNFHTYGTARDKVNAGLTLESQTTKSSDGSLKNTYKWVDSDGKQVSSTDKTKMIATAMRHDLDVS
jgi:hypothetical protein